MSDRNRPPAGIRTIGELDPQATRLVLVRHGESVANAEGLVGGQLGCRGLTALGKAQVSALASRWQRTDEAADVVGLVSSTLLRARQTADLLEVALPAARRLADRRDLSELEVGEADGLSWVEFEQRFGRPDWDRDPGQPIAPGGESWQGFVVRVEAALQALVEAQQGQRVVVCCHAGVIEASLIAHLYDAPPSTRLQLRSDHAGVTEWAIDSRGWRLLSYNSTTPLALVR